MKKEMAETTKKLFRVEADLKAAIAEKVEHIAKEYGYGNIDGLDAVYR